MGYEQASSRFALLETLLGLYRSRKCEKRGKYFNFWVEERKFFGKGVFMFLLDFKSTLKHHSKRKV